MRPPLYLIGATLILVCASLNLKGAEREPRSSPKGENSKGPLEWTVSTLVDRAFTGNAELKSYEAALAVTQGERTQAGLWNNPEISGQYGGRRVFDATSGELLGEGFTVSGEFTQKFEFPGKGTLRKAIADKNIEIATLGLIQFRLALEGQVRNLAVQYLAASSNAAAYEEILERNQTLVELFKQRPKAGSAQILEAQVIEGSLFELRQKIKESAQLREEARVNLNTFVGFPPRMPLNLKDTLDIPRSSSTGDQFLNESSHNLLLKIRASELQAAVTGVSANRLDAAPDFTIGAFYSKDKAADKEINAGVSLSMPLPLWNWNQGNIAAAKARKQQAEALLLDARQKVEGEVERRYRAYQLNLQLLEKFPESELQKLRDSADLADRQYRTGGIGLQLFLDVQQTYLNAQTARNTAALEAWQSFLDLQLLTGKQGMR